MFTGYIMKHMVLETNGQCGGVQDKSGRVLRTGAELSPKSCDAPSSQQVDVFADLEALLTL